MIFRIYIILVFSTSYDNCDVPYRFVNKKKERLWKDGFKNVEGTTSKPLKKAS
jgi:hypothetical protein